MARAGGQYKTHSDTGETTLVKETTRDHPKGNKARRLDQKDDAVRVVEKPDKRDKSTQRSKRGSQ